MSRRKSPVTAQAGTKHPLQRWSERKMRARDEVPEPQEVRQEELTEAPADPPPTDADMPSLDTLTAESDYSAFLSPGVSDGLRRLALRQLFAATKFNVCDGLDDYDEDFTQFAKLGDTLTSDLRHRMEMERQRENSRAKTTTEGEDTKPADTDMANAERVESAEEDMAERESDGGAGSPEADADDPEERA
jgi:hypothetical protein